jgi:hypothetical protein
MWSYSPEQVHPKGAVNPVRVHDLMTRKNTQVHPVGAVNPALMV